MPLKRIWANATKKFPARPFALYQMENKMFISGIMLWNSSINTFNYAKTLTKINVHSLLVLLMKIGSLPNHYINQFIYLFNVFVNSWNWVKTINPFQVKMTETLMYVSNLPCNLWLVYMMLYWKSRNNE